MFEMIPQGLQTSQIEMTQFSDFLGETLGELAKLHPSPQPFIYHYTNTRGFHGIVEEGVIHATHVAYMNDAEEYLHSLSILDRLIGVAQEQSLTESQARILEVMKARVKATNIYNLPPLFVACFSLLDDDLSQWRAYSGPTAGFNIGVSVNHIHQLTQQWKGTFIGRVGAAIYDEKSKERWVAKVIRYFLEMYPDHEAQFGFKNPADYAQRWATDFSTMIMMLAPLFKHSKFSAEQEWRLVLTPLRTDLVRFRPKQGLICPYVAVPLRSNAYEGYTHPLRRIVVGPARYRELNHRAALSMLGLRWGPRIDVNQSEIPYRDMS